KRDGAAARKRVEHARRAPAECLPDLLAEILHVRLVLRLAAPMKNPANRLLDDFFFALCARPLLLLDLLDDFSADALAQFASRLRRARIGQERRNQRAPAGRERPPRRPDV